MQNEKILWVDFFYNPLLINKLRKAKPVFICVLILKTQIEKILWL